MNRQAMELLRYVINGLAATAVHYGVFTFNVGHFKLPSAGLANLMAAFFGITASFLGNRCFVFRHTDAGILRQAAAFAGLYGAMAGVHGVTLWVWTDWMGKDYRVGFLGATLLQMVVGYLGNKFLVFGP